MLFGLEKWRNNSEVGGIPVGVDDDGTEVVDRDTAAVVVAEKVQIQQRGDETETLYYYCCCCCSGCCCCYLDL